jgi:integrase
MSKRPHDISVWAIADRRGKARTKKPWIVRWVVDGHEKSKAYSTRAAADDFRSRILTAYGDGERFSTATGLPVSWGSSQTVSVFEWAQEWVAEQATTWQPRSLKSAVEALSRWIPLVAPMKAPAPPESIRAHLVAVLIPGGESNDAESAAWLRRWSPKLDNTSKEILALAQQAITIGDEGQNLLNTTTSRWLNTAHACIKRAVELEIIERDPWPARPHGHSRRKAVKAGSKPIDIAKLPSPSTMHLIIKALKTHQPASQMYAVMTAVSFFGGLRPSEVVDLRVKHLDLPESGWGSINVIEADVGLEESGDPKTGPRTVPIPPVLVSFLNDWITKRAIQDRLFCTADGNRPTNWNRALHSATKKLGVANIRPYDCRHACATFMLRSGVPMGEVASRMGHSVPVLVKHYARVFEEDEVIANAMLDSALSDAGF